MDAKGAGDMSNGGDLTACDLEPIHIPGSIQPHGLLLIAEVAGRRVFAVAGDVEARLAAHWRDRTLDSLLGVDVGVLMAAHEELNEAIAIAGVAGLEEQFDAIIRIVNGNLVVELEPQDPNVARTSEILHRLDSMVSAFERAPDLQRLCDRAAIAFRELTGFDRVIVYRFLDDSAGIVLAEDRNVVLPSFLNHHFPASDIPKQARALYVRNRVRAIPDVLYVPAPIRGAPGSETVDLSDVALRSVSPIHLKYLCNMGVRASASMSIVKDGALWGMIACHHEAPRRLSPAARAAAGALAGGLARQIRAKEQAEAYREQLRLRAIEDAIVARYDRDAPFHLFARQSGGELARMISADGFAMLHGHELVVTGSCPPEPELRRLARTVAPLAVTGPFVSSALARHVPTAASAADAASGVIAAVIDDEQRTVLLWFRGEKHESINWAGNPHKAVTQDPNEGLAPRASFAAWQEDVRGRARRWTHEEIESVTRLRSALHMARQQRRLRDLNQELAATVAEREALLIQKDHQLREVDSRVQTSLQRVDALLEEASRRLAAVTRLHYRLHRNDQGEKVDLASYLGDLLGDMRTAMASPAPSAMRVDLTALMISLDRATQVGLILTELVINANKHAYGGRSGPLAIDLERHLDHFRLTVADKGRGGGNIGFGPGFGTRMIEVAVQDLGGTVEYHDNRPGLRVIVSAPIAID